MFSQYRAQPKDKPKEEPAAKPVTNNIAAEEGLLEINAIHGQPQPPEGYNQIPMAVEDQEKTTFITERGLYCYMVMPFGLKNAGSTYQRLVNQMFKDQVGKTMEVYIDDMVVKSAMKS
ncbi:unnamed protein product, partial [Prunus brigantina]